MQSYQRFQHVDHTAFNTSGTNGPRSLFRMKAGIHTRLRQQERTQRLTRRNAGYFRWGRYLYPRAVLRGSETLRGRVSERQTLPLLGLGRGESRRAQRAFGTAMRMMRVAVPRRRGPAGLRCSVAGSYAIPVSFAVRYRCIQEQREKFAVGVAWFLLAA